MLPPRITWCEQMGTLWVPYKTFVLRKPPKIPLLLGFLRNSQPHMGTMVDEKKKKQKSDIEIGDW